MQYSFSRKIRKEKKEEGKLYATYEINKKARPFLRQPCKDMVDAMCEMINEEG